MRHLLFHLFVFVALGCACAQAGERVPVEPCTYADDAAAAAAWQPLDESDPVALAKEKTPDGKPALLFRCDMPRLKQRAYWDRTVNLDLSRVGRIAFWIKTEGERSAVGGCTLYFNAGAGWYGSGFPMGGAGWKRLVLDRAQFRSEDAPEGWQAIKGIRFAFWKGQPKQCTVAIGGMEALADDVVVIRNARAGKEGTQYAEDMAKALVRAGIESGTVDDVDVEAGVLVGKRIAVLPLNSRVSDKELDAIEAFVKAGGRLLVCYSLHPRLAALLGLEKIGYMGREYPGQFSTWRFAAGLPGLPKEAKQESWNIERVRPTAGGARVLAEWLDKDGKDTGYPAITLNESGAFLSHVLLDDDRENKDRFLRALLGHLHPGVWEQVARKAVSGVGAVSNWETFAAAEAGIRETARAASRAAAVENDLAQARKAYQEAEAALKAGRFAETLEPATTARQSILAAYCRCQPAREDEYRAVWCHSAYGIAGETWDDAIRRLKEGGFNAVVPNMLWGGVADYRSQVLPVRDRVEKEGDQIALCVAAGKKYGVEVHPWKVNWNLGGAPKEFVERLRAEKRLQFDARGAEHPWLCPSHPANQRLEFDSMIEVARKYDVDGIHFDYIRYPGQDQCYCEGCRQRFEEGTGEKVADWPKDVLANGPRFAAYQEFRRSNITRLVKAVSEEARRAKPGIKVSAAVFRDWPGCREHVGQDWVHWVQQGYLDFVCPMNYTDSNEQFRTWTQVHREAIGGRIPLVPGVGASAPGLPLAQVIDQIRIAREEGAAGFIIFNYDRQVATEYVPALGLGTTAGAVPLPHSMPAVEWRLAQGGNLLAGPARPDAPVQVEAMLTTRGVSGLRQVDATVAVTAPDGTPVKEMGRGKSGGPAVKGEARLVAGLYRVVARGRMALADGTRRPFLVRGPWIKVGE